MPLTKTEWKTIEDKLEAAIKQSQPRGWKKALHVTREWGVLGVNISVILALLALSASQFYQANTRLAKEAAFEATTDQSLKGIQGDIVGIKTDVAKLNLALSASKPIAQFKASLPELHSSLTVAQKQNVKVSPTLIADLQSKLATVGPDAPNYWPAAADFVSYRSFNNATWSPPANLPNCRDTQPSTTTLQNNFQMNGKPQKLETKMMGYHDCQFAFDSMLDGNWLNTLIDPNYADPDLPSDAVRIFKRRLLCQLFGLKTLRQDHKFQTFVFEQHPSHRFFHVGIYSTVGCEFAFLCSLI